MLAVNIRRSGESKASLLGLRNLQSQAAFRRSRVGARTGLCLRFCGSGEEGQKIWPGVQDLGELPRKSVREPLRDEWGWSRQRGQSKSVTPTPLGAGDLEGLGMQQ